MELQGSSRRSEFPPLPPPTSNRPDPTNAPQITQSSFALHEFGRRFAEECRHLETPSGPGQSPGTGDIYARLPSRLMVSQMLGNVAIVQKKLKEVQGVVRRAEEGGYEPEAGKASPGCGEEQEIEAGRRGSVVANARAGRGRVRRRKRDGVEGGAGVTKVCLFLPFPVSLRRSYRTSPPTATAFPTSPPSSLFIPS